MTDVGLTHLATGDLDAILAAVHRGALRCPLAAADIVAHGFGPHARDLLALGPLERSPFEALLRAVIAERRDPLVTQLDLVWTGPEAHASAARDTAVIVRELFESARVHVLVAGFTFDHGAEIFAPLHAAIVAHGVSADVFIELSRFEGETPAARVATFLARNWPFGAPFPSVYYDPDSLAAAARASLHAKCIVVDDARTLITSANFTDRGQSRNVELGVVITDAAFARDVVAQWRGLVDAAVLMSATSP